MRELSPGYDFDSCYSGMGMTAEHRSISIKDLLDAGLIQPGQELRFQGRIEAKATVTPTGAISFQGVDYRTLSGAASAVRGTSRNGWTAWRVQTDRNAWVTLSELRSRLQK